MFSIIVATTAFIVIVLAIYGLGIREGIWPGPRELALFKRESALSGDLEKAVEDLTCPDIHGYECADDDCPCECHDDEDEESDEFPDDSGKAVEVDEIDAMAHFDWIGYREWKRAEMRAKHPRLYSGDWYAKTRAEFSAWSVEVYTYMAETRRECGLAA
jgi:hypothetical protein